MTDRTIWQKAMHGSKFGFDRLWSYADKSGTSVNRVANKIGAEAFWPTSIDKESYKAARILRSFCKDGLYEEVDCPAQDGPNQRQRVIKKIPVEVIKNARGLAIFTTMRSGLWISGAGGSGVLVARMADGTWSPPSGIMLHTAALGFLVGVDIYDCVLVLNTQDAVDAFARWRLILGGEMSATAGPLGVGGIVPSEVHKKQAPIFTYLRSRGFYAGIAIDGTVIVERTDENEKYYNYKYSAAEIISGKVRNPPSELRTLWQTLKLAQGDHDVDHSALPSEPPPADLEVVPSDYVFGVPDKDDPDPFGVLALEKEGLQIREAGTKTSVPSEAFEFRPNPSSPIFDAYVARPFDKDKHISRRSSWRSSSLTVNSLERRYVTMDISTQTDFDEPTSPGVNEFTRALKMESNNLPATPSGLSSDNHAFPQTPPKLPLRPHASRNTSIVGRSGLAPSREASPKPRQVSMGSPSVSQIDAKQLNPNDGDVLVQREALESMKPIEPMQDEARVQDNIVEPSEQTVDSVDTKHNTSEAVIAKNEELGKDFSVPDMIEQKAVISAAPVEASQQLQPRDDRHPEQILEGADDTKSLAGEDSTDDDPGEEEEPVIIEEVQQAARPQVVFKPRVVTIPRYMKPEVPARNPTRMRSDNDSTSLENASMTSVRSSSASQERYPRKESVSSIASSQQRRPSFQSMRSGMSEERSEEKQPLNHAENIRPVPPEAASMKLEDVPIQITPSSDHTADDFELPTTPKDNQSTAPRISLMSMKLGLEDDDDDDDDDDDGLRRPGPLRPSSRGRVAPSNYRYDGKEDDFS